MAKARMIDEGDDGLPRLRVLTGGLAARPPDEDALLDAWLVGDDAAFGALVASHQGMVLAIVRRYAATPEDARDLVQRTFLKAFESARRGLVRGERPAVPFRSWLIRVAVNLAKNHRRDAARWQTAPLDQPWLASEGAAAPEILERAQSAARVRRAAQRLPGRQREVLALRLDAELPFAQIGEALGVSENAAKASFHLALRRLRAEFLPEDA